jgi:hypothetical protein
MLWERDYMKRRSNSDVAATIHAQGAASEPVDIFTGVERKPLHSQAPSTSDSKTGNSPRPLGSPTPLTSSQPELPLNRLLTKHPRLFLYAIIAIGIIIGILLSRI